MDRVGIKMTPGILNSQEIKSDLNSKMLNFNTGFYQLLNMLRKFEKIIIRWIYSAIRLSCILFIIQANYRFLVKKMWAKVSLWMSTSNLVSPHQLNLQNVKNQKKVQIRKQHHQS